MHLRIVQTKDKQLYTNHQANAFFHRAGSVNELNGW